jgi:hypothetical protein
MIYTLKNIEIITFGFGLLALFGVFGTGSFFSFFVRIALQFNSS